MKKTTATTTRRKKILQWENKLMDISKMMAVRVVSEEMEETRKKNINDYRRSQNIRHSLN